MENLSIKEEQENDIDSYVQMAVMHASSGKFAHPRDRKEQPNPKEGT